MDKVVYTSEVTELDKCFQISLDGFTAFPVEVCFLKQVTRLDCIQTFSRLSEFLILEVMELHSHMIWLMISSSIQVDSFFSLNKSKLQLLIIP